MLGHRTLLAPAQSSRFNRTRRLRLQQFEARAIPSAGYEVLPPFVGTPEPNPVDPLMTRSDPSTTFHLHTRPGASCVIFLDFDGHVTTGTEWNNPGPPSITTPAFDISGNGPAFTLVELARIRGIWRRVAEDYSPFDVDVTTEDPGLVRLQTAGSIRVVVGGNSAWLGGPAGGVAFVGSFTWGTDTCCFVFENNLANGHEKYTADAISHEVGHTLGLSHDGYYNPSTGLFAEYYPGHGTGPTGWAPIMGVGYYEPLVQWSRGEYFGANNAEDDLAIITSQNGFGYVPDDHANDRASASPATVTGTTISGSGVIGQRTDVDFFRFETGPGRISITVRPAGRGPNLDVLANLYDAAGNLVASANPAGVLTATLTADVPTGEYFLKIDGTGRNGWYTDYDSLGQYSFTGTIREVPPVDPPRVLGVTAVDSAAGKVAKLRLEFNVPIDRRSLNAANVKVTGPDGSAVPVLGFRSVKGATAEYDVLIRPQALTGDGGLRVFVSPSVHTIWPKPLDQDNDGVQGEVEDFYAASVFGFDTTGGSIADAGTTDFPLAIGRSLNLDDVNVRVDLTHPYVGDLTIQLVSPNSTVVTLFDGPGGDGDNLWNTWFDDGSGVGIDSAAAPFRGVFHPAGSLADLVGQDAMGTWILRVIDAYPGAAGEVNSWGLTLTTDASRQPVTVVGITPVNETGSSLATLVRSFTIDFNVPMNPASISVKDVKVTNPTGRTVPVRSVVPVPGTNHTRFRVTTAAWTKAGVYAVKIGPAVADVYGNGLDGNANGRFLEPADAATFTHTIDNNVYLSPPRPVAIPRQGSMTSAIAIAGNVSIGQLAIELNVLHPSVGDLKVTLIAPNGTQIVLVDHRGGANPDFVRTILADGATTPVGTALAPYNGDFQPEEALGGLTGTSARGTWKLRIEDTGTGAAGALLSWRLYVKPQ
jgi:subtilisin-like proprotein convertase family protein